MLVELKQMETQLLHHTENNCKQFYYFISTKKKKYQGQSIIRVTECSCWNEIKVDSKCYVGTLLNWLALTKQSYIKKSVCAKTGRLWKTAKNLSVSVFFKHLSILVD